MLSTYLPEKSTWGEVDWVIEETELGGVALATLHLPIVKRGAYPLKVDFAQASTEQRGERPNRDVGVECSLGIYRGDEASSISRPTFRLQMDGGMGFAPFGWELRALRALLFDDDLRWVPSIIPGAAVAEIEVVLLNDRLRPAWTHYHYPTVGLHVIHGHCHASWQTMLWWDLRGKWRFLREGGLPPGSRK